MTIAFTRQRLRIYVFAGPNGVDINKWHVRLLEESLLTTMYEELRAEHAAAEE